MRKTQTFSLDEGTIKILEKQAKKMHLSKSAFIRFLLVQNDRNDKSNKGGDDFCD